MRWLTGAEQWTTEAVLARIKFEQSVSSGSETLLVEMADGLLASQNIPSDAIFAMGRAAEIAFATDRFDLGVRICVQLLESKEAKILTPMQFVFKASLGALLGQRRVHLQPKGVLVTRADKTTDDFYRWDAASPVQLGWMIRHLLAPAAASGPPSETLGGLFLGSTEPSIGADISHFVLASPEYDVIASLDYPERFPDRKIFQILQGLEERYSRRLKLLISDKFYWSTLRPRGAIIDWPLLCLWTALYRFYRDAGFEGEFPHPQNEEADFIRSLASSLATSTSHEQDGPRFR
jgi:hypothetical protein